MQTRPINSGQFKSCEWCLEPHFLAERHLSGGRRRLGRLGTIAITVLHCCHFLDYLPKFTHHLKLLLIQCKCLLKVNYLKKHSLKNIEKLGLATLYRWTNASWPFFTHRPATICSCADKVTFVLMSLLAVFFYLLDTLYASFASTKGHGNLRELSVYA